MAKRDLRWRWSHPGPPLDRQTAHSDASAPGGPAGLPPAAHEAYDRAASQGRAADLRLLHRPIDHRRWGESSWLNYWQGRDEGLWVVATGDTGHEGPSTNGAHHQRRMLGGS
jgi:hypothetical protein